MPMFTPRPGDLFKGSTETLSRIVTGVEKATFPNSKSYTSERPKSSWLTDEQRQKMAEMKARQDKNLAVSNKDASDSKPYIRANAGQPVSSSLFATPAPNTGSEKAPRLVPSAQALKDLLPSAVLGSSPNTPANRTGR